MLSCWRDPRSRFKLVYKVILHWGSAMIRGSLVQVSERTPISHRRAYENASIVAVRIRNPDYRISVGRGRLTTESLPYDCRDKHCELTQTRETRYH